MSEKGVKFVTSSRNRKKQFTQINGNIALCQKSRQQYNWHGDFVFENAGSEMNFDEDLERVSHSGGVLRQALAMMKELESDLHSDMRGTI